MHRQHGYEKRRDPTSLSLESALHGHCARGDTCAFGHGDDDDVVRGDCEQLQTEFHSESKEFRGVSDPSATEPAVTNVIEAQISSFDDDDHGECDCTKLKTHGDWHTAMAALKLDHDDALQQQALKALATHQQVLDQLRAAHASEVAQLNERMRLLTDCMPDPVAPSSVTASINTGPLSSPEMTALVVGVSLAVTQVAECCAANSGHSASKFVLNPCLAAVLDGTKAAAPVSWLRFRPSLLAMGTATASDFVIGFHGSPAPEAIMCQGWDTKKRQGQQHGPGEYFDTDMQHSLCLYSRNSRGVVVALIVRSKAKQVQPTWLLVNNPKGAPNASTPAFCFPLGYVMVPSARLRACTTCAAVAVASPPARVAALTNVQYHQHGTWRSADRGFARNVLAQVAVGLSLSAPFMSQYRYSVQLQLQPDGRTYAGTQTNTFTGMVRQLRVV